MTASNKPIKIIEDAVEELKRYLEDTDWQEMEGDNLVDVNPYEWLRSKLTQAKEETEKSFGGCIKCYGKGYSTVKMQARTGIDFGGEKPKKWELNPIHPCSCDRGKQIKVILSNTNK